MVRRGVRILLAVVLVGIVLAVVTWARGPGAVYTVAQVYSGLAHHRRAWVGRTVTVRGTLVMVQGQGGGVSNGPGVWTGFCVTTKDCSLGVPFDTTVHLVLIARGSYAITPGGPSNPPDPPLLVMRTLIRRNPINRQLSNLFEPITPAFIMQPLARLSVVYDILKTAITMEGDAPRLYRIRILMPQKSCVGFVACDDAVLLDALQ